MELPDRTTCYRALQGRDARFDGLIFVGVSSTGVFCRPVCPARTPRFEHCRFFGSAAAAQGAGFRPCLRCCPETAPDLAFWSGSSDTVTRALALIAEGALDGEGSGVTALADRVGVGARQLRRLFHRHLGASPIAVAKSRRALFAKRLIEETGMSMIDVAMASGFGSLRRFNETFQELFHRPPSALRRRRGTPADGADATAVTLRLRYRPPYDWDSMLGYLAARAITGVEHVAGDRYFRTAELDGEMGSVEVSHRPEHDSLEARIMAPNVRLLPGVVARIRRVFDLGADIETINAHLSMDPLLAPWIAHHPGLRAPGGWEGFEVGVRAVLGQQITVSAARRLASQLVERHGRAVPEAFRIHPSLTRTFPDPERLAAGPIGLGMPGQRLRALSALAEAAVADRDLFRPSRDIGETIARLTRITGVGQWTAHYVALRATRETDAFPATDVGLLRGAASALGLTRTSASDLLAHAESWRPWRAYAAQHLWSIDADREVKEALRA